MMNDLAAAAVTAVTAATTTTTTTVAAVAAVVVEVTIDCPLILRKKTSQKVNS
eukprot:CAMPEP_0170939072 /NCGR_PEP_ID=MMETSP0735-20130129/21640_1 /TAXON_ID=186038 /ORGANISM="Fragilariopsis kerguelensis, Strain L26-C5" /LENGTH=52 /DNA_ID=CAMNT_0011344231 /DNA_START=124 /DNA_END=282 /DNA_ORIENTATION=-